MRKEQPPIPVFSDLSITTERWGEWLIISLAGKFVVQSFSLLRNEFNTLEYGKKPHIALDLTGVTQIDSSALTIILNFQKRLKENRGKLVVFGPNAIIKDTLHIVGFNRAVPMYNTRAIFEKSETAQ